MYCYKIGSKYANLAEWAVDVKSHPSEVSNPLLEGYGSIISRMSSRYCAPLIKSTTKPNMIELDNLFEDILSAETKLERIKTKTEQVIEALERFSPITDEQIYDAYFNDPNLKVYYGFMPYYQKDQKDIKEKRCNELTAQVNKNRRETAKSELEKGFLLLQKVKIVPFEIKVMFSGKAEKIRHAVQRKNQQPLRNICSQCRVLIPTKEMFSIDTGSSGRTLNVCPFCMVRMAGDATQIQEKFAKEHPKYIDEYETQLVLRNL